jgi:hypothetical protein
MSSLEFLDGPRDGNVTVGLYLLSDPFDSLESFLGSGSSLDD